MKTIYFSLAVLLIVGQIALGAGSKRAFALTKGDASTQVSTTYASGQTDTLVFTRESGISALAVGLHAKDSVNITNMVVKRIIDGFPMATIAGDTVMSADSLANEGAWTKTIPLAPLASQYWVIVKYKTNTSSLDQGTTTPTVIYRFNVEWDK